MVHGGNHIQLSDEWFPYIAEAVKRLRGQPGGRVRNGRVIAVAGHAFDEHPEPGGAEYIAVCMPGFGVESVRRDA